MREKTAYSVIWAATKFDLSKEIFEEGAEFIKFRSLIL